MLLAVQNDGREHQQPPPPIFGVGSSSGGFALGFARGPFVGAQVEESSSFLVQPLKPLQLLQPPPDASLDFKPLQAVKPPEGLDGVLLLFP